MSKYRVACYNCKKEKPEYVVRSDDKKYYHGLWEMYEYLSLCKKCAMVHKILIDGEALKIKKIRYYNTTHNGKPVIISTVDKYKGRLIEAYCIFL